MYALEETIDKLTYTYTNFFGRSGNRKLKKYDISLFKSLSHHTSRYNVYFSNGKVPFSCQLLIIGKYGCKPPKSIFCYCGKRICYNKVTQQFNHNSICRECGIPMNSKKYFMHRYGDIWEEEYEKYFKRPYMQKIMSARGRRAVQVRRERGDIGLVAKGKYEKVILDHIEQKHQIKIDRNFTVEGFYPDGYCHETNTIYEVYEPYHNYRVEKDNVRQKIITDALNCNFIIIRHESKFDINKIKIDEFYRK